MQAEELLSSPEINEAVNYHARRMHLRYPKKWDIDDARQELYLTLVEKSPKYDPSRSNPLTFANMVCLNRVRSAGWEFSNRKRHKTLFATETVDNPELFVDTRRIPVDETAIVNINIDIIRESLSKVDNDYVLPIFDMRMQGFNQAECARHLGISGAYVSILTRKHIQKTVKQFCV